MSAPIQEIGLLSTLVISLVAAFGGGLLVRALNLPPLLGYLMAGVLIGPFTPGVIANQAMANELAEIGVALLLFNIGLHFSFKDLIAVQKVVVPGALIQVILTTIAGGLLASLFFEVSFASAFALGLSMAIASTAVATRVLDERHQLTSLAGRIALGWLVVQDLIVIVAMVIFPLLGVSGDVSFTKFLSILGQTFLQVTGFVAVMVFGGRKVIPALLQYVARVGSRELFTLAVIVIALGIAYGSSILFGVSLALGAFFAGVVIGESDLNHHAASEAVAIQQVFTILFFVSVGMLFDPRSLIQMPLEILSFLAVIMLGTGFLTFVISLYFNVPLQSAALVGATFAQIGEFSFVLSELGFKSGFYEQNERDLIIAVALFSIVVNPLVLRGVLRAARWAAAHPKYIEWQASHLDLAVQEKEGMTEHTIIVGHGRVGGIVAAALKGLGLPYVSIESDRALTEKLREHGEIVIFGDASREAVMSAAKPQYAKLVIVAVPDPYFTRQIVRSIRKNYPDIVIVARTHSDEEAKALTKLGVGLAVMGEREVAFGMMYYALQVLGFDSDRTRSTIGHIRKEAYSYDQQDEKAVVTP